MLSVTTNAADVQGPNSAILHATDAQGDPDWRGFVYSLSPNPMYGQSGCSYIGDPVGGNGDYDQQPTLQATTHYYFKAVVGLTQGETFHGSQLEFDTPRKDVDEL